jgi:hypothetical protein
VVPEGHREYLRPLIKQQLNLSSKLWWCFLNNWNRLNFL